MNDKKKIVATQPYDFFAMLGNGMGWGQFDLSASGIHPVQNGKKVEQKENKKTEKQKPTGMEYHAPAWEIPSLPMNGMDMVGMMSFYKKPEPEQNVSGKTKTVVLSHKIENKMEGFHMPTLGDIDMRGLDEKIGDMFKAPRTSVDMSVVAHNNPMASMNVTPQKKVTTSPKSSGGKSSMGRSSAPVMKNMGGGMDMSRVPSGMMAGYGIPEMAGGIPTMGDVMKGAKGMGMPTLSDLVQGQDKAEIHPLGMMDMGSITTPKDMGEGIMKAVKGIDDTIKNVNNSYRTIKGIPTWRKKLNKGAFGNPKEDEFHPDNVPTFKKGYDTYVVNPITGKEQLQTDYIKEHNQYYLQGKTPSSQHTIGKDVANKIRQYLARKEAEKQLTNIRAFSDTVKAIRQENENHNDIGDVVSQGNLQEFDSMDDMAKFGERPSPDWHMGYNVRGEPTGWEQNVSTPSPQNRVEIGLPPNAVSDVVGKPAVDFDLTRDVMSPSLAMQGDASKSLTDAPEPMDFEGIAQPAKMPQQITDEINQSPSDEVPQNKEGTWCFYIRDNGRASVASGEGTGAGTMKCYQGYDLANNFKNRFRSMGFEVSGMFTKTR